VFDLRRKPSVLDTDELNAFFDVLDHMGDVELLRMRAAWQAVPKRIHEEVWAAVRAVGARDGLSRDIDRVRKRAMAWVARGSDVVPYALSDSATWAQVKLEAEEAIVDVALGIALGDRLDERMRETLLAAWVGAR
jgi:hypothetical protein